ncbi:MAG TPA: hypothetical protein VGQ83_05920 [Polyangia bacterium]
MGRGSSLPVSLRARALWALGLSAGLLLGGCDHDAAGFAPADGGPSRPVTHASPGAPLPLARCGDGHLDPGEPCDGVLLGGATCASLGYVGGALACAACRFDTSGCQPGAWPRSFAQAGYNFYQDWLDVAVDPADNLLVVGGYDAYEGAIDVGNGPLARLADWSFLDAFVVKYDRHGRHLWSQRLGDGHNNRALGVAADGAGNVLVTGFSEDGWPILDGWPGGGPPADWQPARIFVTKLDPAGTVVWERHFPTTEAASARYMYLMESHSGLRVQADADGNVVVGGNFTDRVSFGGEDLQTEGDVDLFLVKLTPDGQHLWSRRFGHPLPALAQGIINIGSLSALRLDAAGNLVVNGTVDGPLDFGGGPLGSAPTLTYVAKLDPDGRHRWSRGYAGAVLRGVALDGAGSVIGTGFVDPGADLGGGPLAGNGVVLLKLTADGAHAWSRLWPGPMAGHSIALTPAGEILAGGRYWGAVAFGPARLGDAPATGGGFVARFDAAGGALGAVQVGTSSLTDVTVLAVDHAGTPFPAGWLYEPGPDPAVPSMFVTLAVP